MNTYFIESSFFIRGSFTRINFCSYHKKIRTNPGHPNNLSTIIKYSKITVKYGIVNFKY